MTELSWYDADDPPGRRDLNTCIHCGLCLTACPTYRELKIEPDSPRGRIYLMRGLAEGRIAPSEPLLSHLDQCLGCRACETVCPAGVPYGRMLEEARGQLSRRASHRSPLRRLGEWTLRHVVAHRARMHAAISVLRLGQTGPVAAFMRSPLARFLPDFAVRGFAMTPPLASREARRLETVARELPAGARMTARPDALVFSPASAPRARVGFFTTCVMETMFPRQNQEAVRLLVLAGCEVVVPRAQGCCGALHAHAGLRHSAKDLARTNVAAFADPGLEFIVTDSAGCGAALRDYGHLLAGAAHGDAGATPAPHPAPRADAEAFAHRVRDVSEVLAQLGMPEGARPLASSRDASRPLRIGYHDPCHLAHAQKVRAQPRALLARLPGVELVDLPNPDWCCGSAGVYNLTHPEMAELELQRKLDSIAAVTPELVVASNPGCMLHMQRGAVARGMTVRIVHLVDVLARAYPPADRA